MFYVACSVKFISVNIVILFYEHGEQKSEAVI